VSDFLLILLVLFIVFGVFRRVILAVIMTAFAKVLFRQMERMQKQAMKDMQRPSAQAPVQNDKGRKNEPPDGDYVDFEEIRD
jgi:hypothetical protein